MRAIRGHHPVLGVLAAGSLVLTGCGGGSESESVGGQGSTLTVWVDVDRARVFEAVAEDFTAETGIAVNLVQQDLGEIPSQFTSQVPTGEGPDLAVGAHDWLGQLVTDGLVAPVEIGDRAEEFEDVALEAWTYNGRVYGIPYSIENIALLRNAELVPEAPEDFDEMVEMGQESGAERPFVIGLDPAESDPFHLYPFQTSFGAPIFGTTDEGDADPEDLQIGNDGGLEFADWLREQGESGVFNLNIDGDLAKENFNSGDAAFYLSGPWNAGDALDAGIDLAVDPVPAPGPEEAQPFAAVQGVFLSAQSENTVAANTFLTEYVASAEVQNALYEAGGRAPALSESFEAATADDEITQGFGAAAENAVPMPSIPEMGAVWEFWSTTQAAIISGDGDPESLWSDMTDDIEASIQE